VDKHSFSGKNFKKFRILLMLIIEQFLNET